MAGSIPGPAKGVVLVAPKAALGGRAVPTVIPDLELSLPLARWRTTSSVPRYTVITVQSVTPDRCRSGAAFVIAPS